jgi:hypothetical protein|tara:strand:- start:180 stop:386 length:207 start_codon:yes stop_codon:yes gene_type:complete
MAKKPKKTLLKKASFAGGDPNVDMNIHAFMKNISEELEDPNLSPKRRGILEDQLNDLYNKLRKMGIEI